MWLFKPSCQEEYENRISIIDSVKCQHDNVESFERGATRNVYGVLIDCLVEMVWSPHY